MRAAENQEPIDADNVSTRLIDREPYRLAARAFGLIEKFKTPPVPETYCLWYSYVSRSNPELVRRVDEILDGKDAISNSELEKIYRATNLDEMQFVERNRIAKEFEGEMSSVLQIIEDGADTTRKFGSKLNEFAEELPANIASTKLNGLLKNLVDENRKMANLAEDLATGLQQSKNHVELLKLQLAEVQKRCMLDPLTGVANRRAFDERLDEEIANARGVNYDLCLVMADIDYFKKVNDEHGHQVGDVVLCMFAQLLQRSVKGDDFVARYGGEEFSIILPSTGLFSAHNLMVKLKHRFQNLVLEPPGMRTSISGLTASFGVAGLRPGMTAATFVAEADAQLYRAKNSGRNCVMTSGID